jgi:phosphoribosylformylglycinamidine synthase II
MKALDNQMDQTAVAQQAAQERLGPEACAALATQLNLLPQEFEHIVQALGRLPRRTELAVFAGMYSEHCSYKSTRHLLATLPKTGPRVLAGPGAHAGVVDVGEGYAVAFKIESHNHPSAVEPYQGAATGVGGILRDIIAQGARPCALLDALCFGNPQTDGEGRSLRHGPQVRGVVQGIAGYGNAIGVANVGGKTTFDSRYAGNPLVNALAAGLLRHGPGHGETLRHARAQGLGNKVLYVGAATGRDGILGAAFASEELGDSTQASRPHVQVGDPFAGKKLMEACLSFTPELGMLACQDMGACGITCASVEMAAAGNVGMRIDLQAVPLREANMAPQEILLSESQERFLFVIEAGCASQALHHFHSHGVLASICGEVVAGDRVCVQHGNTVFVDLPAKLVADGFLPLHWPQAQSLPAALPYAPFAPADVGQTLLQLLRLPGLGDLQPLTQRYDQSIGCRTVRGPSQCAAVLRLPGLQRGFALCISGRGAVCAADPFLGAQAALADGLRDLACVGAKLVAITDGLNMASPQRPEEMRRIAEVIRGLKEGLEALNVPVTGGNVSLYNESPQGPIPPTPLVGSLGLVTDVAQVPTAALQPGQTLLLLGEICSAPVFSTFANVLLQVEGGAAPHVDLSAEQRLANFLVGQVRLGRVAAARGIGRGGLAAALAKLCLQGGCGAQVALPLPEGARADWAALGDYAALIWVGCAPESAVALLKAAAQAGVPALRAGTAGGSRLQMHGILDVGVEALQAAYAQAGVGL